MKEIQWLNPNKMKMESGNKTFDSQCLIISKGNTIAPTQLSFIVRPKHDTLNAVNERCPQSHLQNFDLKSLFSEWSCYRSTISELSNQNHGVYVYQFFHFSGKSRIDNCLLITDKKHKVIKKVTKRFNPKTMMIFEEILKYFE